MNERLREAAELIVYAGVDAYTNTLDVYGELDENRYSTAQRIGLTAAKIGLGAVLTLGYKINYYADARALIEPFKHIGQGHHNAPKS